jgi:hypothetical protein
MTALTLLLTAAMTRCVALLASASAILTRNLAARPGDRPHLKAAAGSTSTARKPQARRLLLSSPPSSPGSPRKTQERPGTSPHGSRTAADRAALDALSVGLHRSRTRHTANGVPTPQESQRISKNLKERPITPRNPRDASGTPRRAKGRRRRPPHAAGARRTPPSWAAQRAARGAVRAVHDGIHAHHKGSRRRGEEALGAMATSHMVETNVDTSQKATYSLPATRPETHMGGCDGACTFLDTLRERHLLDHPGPRRGWRCLRRGPRRAPGAGHRRPLRPRSPPRWDGGDRRRAQRPALHQRRRAAARLQQRLRVPQPHRPRPRPDRPRWAAPRPLRALPLPALHAGGVPPAGAPSGAARDLAPGLWRRPTEPHGARPCP